MNPYIIPIVAIALTTIVILVKKADRIANR